MPVRLAVGVTLLLGLLSGAAMADEGRVSLELATQEGFPAAAAQEWYTILTDLKIDGLQIRQSRAGDEPSIETTGSGSRPVYRVTGLLTADNELVLPGGRFSRRDRSKLLEWLKRLRQDGPEHAQAARPLPFGLAKDELAAAHKDLSRPVSFSTSGIELDEAMERIAARLERPLSIDRAAREAIAEAEPATEELQGLSSGTALAYLLRAAGLVLEPRRDRDRQVEYAIKLPVEGQPVWPVGWPREAAQHELVPDLLEWLNVEIDDVPLERALEAVGQRLDLPILYDHHALIREDIDLAEVRVSMRPGRTFYAKVLKSVLQQAQLTSELRTDEAGKPLLWVTTLKKP